VAVKWRVAAALRAAAWTCWTDDGELWASRRSKIAVLRIREYRGTVQVVEAAGCPETLVRWIQDGRELIDP
jgi:hypothetical protein